MHVNTYVFFEVPPHRSSFLVRGVIAPLFRPVGLTISKPGLLRGHRSQCDAMQNDFGDNEVLRVISLLLIVRLTRLVFNRPFTPQTHFWICLQPEHNVHNRPFTNTLTRPCVAHISSSCTQQGQCTIIWLAQLYGLPASFDNYMACPPLLTAGHDPAKGTKRSPVVDGQRKPRL